MLAKIKNLAKKSPMGSWYKCRKKIKILFVTGTSGEFRPGYLLN